MADTIQKLWSNLATPRPAATMPANDVQDYDLNLDKLNGAVYIADIIPSTSDTVTVSKFTKLDTSINTNKPDQEWIIQTSDIVAPETSVKIAIRCDNDYEVRIRFANNDGSNPTGNCALYNRTHLSEQETGRTFP